MLRRSIKLFFELHCFDDRYHGIRVDQVTRSELIARCVIYEIDELKWHLEARNFGSKVTFSHKHAVRIKQHES